MFGNIFSAFKNEEFIETEAPATRRRHTRRPHDKCIAFINGQMHPVSDWSIGGLQVSADDRLYAVNDAINIELKFDVGGADMLDVQHPARVVRKSHGKLGLQFEPLTAEVRRKFQNIVNECMADEFSTSQETF